MSWVTDRVKIDTILTGLTYTQVAVSEQTEDEPFAPHKSFYYNLKKTGTDGLGLTSNAAAFCHKVMLEVFYINKTTVTRDTNADNFDSVMSGIIALPEFHGEISSDFEDIDEDHSKGTFNFLFGFESC